MAVKNVNIFEQHVEKIVLAVAVAGAAFMGYMAIQPVSLSDDPDVKPDNIEQKISDELDQMERLRDQMDFKRPPAPALNYDERYRQLTSTDPLDPKIVAWALPPFGPSNMSPSYVSGPVNETYQIVTPEPVAPEMITAEPWQHPVAAVAPPPNSPGGVVPPAAAQPGAAPLPSRDQNATLIQGYIPIGKMRVQLESQQGLSRLPDPYRLAEIYRIRVQRRERTASGWTEPTEVKPTQATTPPTEIDFKTTTADSMPTNLQLVDTEFPLIVLPTFYLDPDGAVIQAPAATQPLSKKLDDENRKIQEDLDRAKAPAGARITPTTPPPAPAEGTAQPLTPEAIKQLQIVPFVFWDETVQPDHTYQYEVEVDFLNPAYQWPAGLKNPAMKAKPILTTGWNKIGAPVTITSDLVFYITSSLPGSSGVSARVFKKNNGKWYTSSFDAQSGMNIAGKIPLVDQGNQSIDVDTNYTVVDAQQAEGNTHVILKDPTGNLVTRDSSADLSDPQMRKLQDESVKRAAATAPTPEPGSNVNPNTPRTPTTPQTRPYPPVSPQSRPYPVPVPVNPQRRTGY